MHTAGKPFDNMNGVAANMLLNMTSSVRFEGSLNVDLNDITMNLVPFPQVGHHQHSASHCSSWVIMNVVQAGQ